MEEEMRKLATLALFAGLAGLGSAALLAQETTTPTEEAAPAETTEPSDAAASGEGELVAMEEALAAIEDVGVTEEAITGVTADADVQVVLLSKLQGGVTAVSEDDLRAAMETNQEHVAMVREAIAANDTLSTALSDAGFSDQDVMAIAIAPDGRVRIFVDDGEGGSESEDESGSETPAN
jgi:hypothetical protein